VAGQIGPAIERLREAAGLLRAAEDGSLLTAMTLMDLGSALREAGNLDKAVDTLREALDVAAPLDDPEGRHGNALILSNLSNALEDAGDPVGSFAALDRARTLLEELTKAGHSRWRDDLARVYQNLTAKLVEMESFELAKEFAEDGVQLYEELIGGQGRDDLVTGMAKLLLGAGRAHKRLFELGKAIACFDRALAVLARAPSTPERQNLARTMSQVVALYRPLLQATSDQFESWAELADTLVAQAQDLAEAGDNDGACDEFDEPIEIYRFLADAAQDPAYLELCAQSCFWKAVAALHARRPYAVEWALGQTVAFTETLMREHGRTDLLEHWADAQIARAAHLASYGDIEGAEDVADEMKDYLTTHHAGEHDRLAAAIAAAIAEHAGPVAQPGEGGEGATHRRHA
jgi:tetratricopeptide (TPR) repeat protein